MNQATFSDIAQKTDAVTLASPLLDIIAPNDVVTVPKATFAEKLKTVLTKFGSDAVFYVDRNRSKIIVTTATSVRSALTAAEPSPEVEIETVPGEVTASRAQFRYSGAEPISPTATQAKILAAINAKRPSLSFDAILDIVDKASPGAVLKYNQTTGRLSILPGTFAPAAVVPSNPATQTVTLDYSEILPVQSTTGGTGFFDRVPSSGGGVTIAKPNAPTLALLADQHDGTFNVSITLPTLPALATHFALFRDNVEVYNILQAGTMIDLAVNESHNYAYKIVARDAGNVHSSQPSNVLTVNVPASQPLNLPPGVADGVTINSVNDEGGGMISVNWTAPQLPPRATSFDLYTRDPESSSLLLQAGSTPGGTGTYGPFADGVAIYLYAHGPGGDTIGNEVIASL